MDLKDIELQICPHCGAPVKLSDAVFCTVCGKSLS